MSLGLAGAELARGELDDRRRRSRTRRAARRARWTLPRLGVARGWPRRCSRRRASARASRRSIARGPAPMISTSSVCASSGKAASTSRNARTTARDAALRVVAAVLLARPARIASSTDVDRGVEEREDAVLLVVEVLVERRLRHAGLARDRLGGRVGVARRGRTRRRPPRTGARAGGPGAPRAAARGARAVLCSRSAIAPRW